MCETTHKTISSNLVGDASNSNQLTHLRTTNRLPTFFLAIVILIGLTQLAGVAVELALYDTVAQLEELPTVVHPQVVRLMKKHGVQFFDYRDDINQYGFWRDGRWCPAK